jgi:hypothetical protein
MRHVVTASSFWRCATVVVFNLVTLLSLMGRASSVLRSESIFTDNPSNEQPPLQQSFSLDGMKAHSDLWSHEFFRTPYLVTPQYYKDNPEDTSMHILFGQRVLTSIGSPFVSNEPTGYITAKFFFAGKSTASDGCVGYATQKTNAMGMCFADFSNGGSMMFTTPATSIGGQMLFLQHYYTTKDCSGTPLTQTQYLPTECMASKYSDPLGNGSPFYYEYSATPPSIHDYGLLMTSYTVKDDCYSKLHASYYFWFPIGVCQNGMLLTSCEEGMHSHCSNGIVFDVVIYLLISDSSAYSGNTTIEFYNSRLCQGAKNNTQARTHKHCLASNDDDEPQNNYYTTKCTGVPHPVQLYAHTKYVFPFCFAASETVQVLVSHADQSSSTSVFERVSYRTVPILEVAVGDRILSARSKDSSNPFSEYEYNYSEVISIPHKSNDYEANFYHFVTESGTDVKMMGKHVVSVVDDCYNRLFTAGQERHITLKLADEVTTNDCLITARGIGDSGYERVKQINYIQGTGLVTVVTMEEFVVVNGVVASPFAGNHAAAHAFYNVLRFTYTHVKWLYWILQSDLVKRAGEMFQMLVVAFVELPRS